MELKGHIVRIQNYLKTGHYRNEASVSQGIVLPILQALDWPIFDSRIVWPEFALEGRRVDFALCYPVDKPIVFIEVKQPGHSEGADRQLFEYAFHLGVPMAILTDGQEWHFYLPAEQGLYQERRVYKLDLLERSIEECELRLRRYVDYKSISTGKALEEARRDYQSVSRDRQIDINLPIAWKKLLEESDEILLELVADKVESLCGYKPDLDKVSKFLSGGLFGSHVQISQQPQQRNLNTSSNFYNQAVSSVINKLPFVGFCIQGKEYKAKTAREVMITLFQELAKRNKTFLDRFASRPHGKKRRYIAQNKSELYPGRPDLEIHSYQLSGGWWIGVNYSKENIEKIIRMACEVAGLNYESEVITRLE